MARIKFTLLLSLLGLAACAPSPLYVSGPRIGTGGEIPRDGRGEPIWGAITQPVPLPPPPIMPVGVGVPITPPA
ncbi:hypothetical protein GCM10011529_09090 [Polymorphobacter glacialis]|uniref:Uncharacterized protein n=1 Tax=Sandarakinorhabdus glacialis TaxID=1614636 RepID=A0A916ZMQ3_9SPHN|nr:hypothetical protein [Polymorphobacter glacialis]GGE04917.1 hypothetical protein GCM10011529_09090 [Polymorphobacter glacialis]